MKQNYTSANTSINENRLPALYSKVDFKRLFSCGMLRVLDYGCGKFDNGMQYIENMGGSWYGFDKYNRPADENRAAMAVYNCANFECMLCANVLNVIDSENEIQKIANLLTWPMDPYFVSVYEGDRTGNGKPTKKDCYQRNEKVREYLKFFPGAVLKHGVITNCPECVF